jgi:hypothetical protein
MIENMKTVASQRDRNPAFGVNAKTGGIHMRTRLLSALLYLLPLLLMVCTVTKGQEKQLNISVIGAPSRLAAALHNTPRFPHGWQLVVLNEHDWFARPEAQRTLTAWTSLENRVTVLRAVYVVTATDSQLHHTIVHELGHVTYMSDNEVAAEAFANSH